MTSAQRGRIEGLVLCRVGDHRLAFPATGVEQISDWAIGGRPVPLARAAFALPPHAGRLVEENGGGLVVDSLEIATDALVVMPVPPLLAGSMGGALKGFVQLSGELCPLLSVSAFAAYLQAREAAP